MSDPFLDSVRAFKTKVRRGIEILEERARAEGVDLAAEPPAPVGETAPSDKPKAEPAGAWRTVNGSHVYIENGRVTKGHARLQGKHIADLDTHAKAAEQHLSNHRALHEAGHALRADASLANVSKYRAAYRAYKAGAEHFQAAQAQLAESGSDRDTRRRGVEAARQPFIHAAVKDLFQARQAHAQARVDRKGLGKARQRLKRAEAAVDALKDLKSRVVGYKDKRNGEWSRFWVHHPDGTVTYHDRRPEPPKPAKPPKAPKAAPVEKAAEKSAELDFEHPPDTSSGQFTVDYSPPVGIPGARPKVMTAARKEWALKAQTAGVDPRHLHGLAADLMAQDFERHADLRELLEFARGELKGSTVDDPTGGVKRAATRKDRQNIRAFVAGRHHAGHDWIHAADRHAVPGIDEAADQAAERWPAFFPKDQTASDRLFDLLKAGNPEALEEGDAYERALRELEEHAGRHQQEREVGDEPDDEPEHKKHDSHEESIPFGTTGPA